MKYLAACRSTSKKDPLDEFPHAPVDEGRELHVIGRGDAAFGSHRIGDTIAPVGGLEIPQMAILLAQCGLNDVTKHLEAGGDRHVDLAPDGRLDVVQNDVQAGNGVGAHDASLAGSRD